MKSHFLARLLSLTALMVAFAEVVMAQPGSGGPTPTTPAVDPNAVPLDGGVSLLLAGGVAYGLKHLRNRRKKA